MDRKDRLIKESNRVLTNYFNKNMSTTLTKALTNRFQFVINNPSSNGDKQVAIAVANFATIDVTAATRANAYQNKTELAAAGYNCDVILDDATVSDVVMGAADSQKTIRHFMEHMKNNARYIKKITINVGSGNSAAFDTTLTIANVTPFGRGEVKDLDVNQFFERSQFQDGKVELPFEDGELAWDSNLYMAMTVLSGYKYSISVEFYN